MFHQTEAIGQRMRSHSIPVVGCSDRSADELLDIEPELIGSILSSGKHFIIVGFRPPRVTFSKVRGNASRESPNATP